MTQSPGKKKHLDSLVMLRAIAVIAVCFCHFGGALSTEPASWPVFTIFHNYGNYGVHVFFVISGFVIPLSLYYGQYQLTDYGKFLYKRLMRLHPPYLLAVALTLIIMVMIYRVKHQPFPETAGSIIGSVFYLDFPHDNGALWTLAIEAQFYLFIGLFYTVMQKYPKLALLILVPAVLLLSRFSDFGQVVPLLFFIVFFLIGTAGFMIYVNHGSRPVNYLVLLVLIVSSFVWYETAAALAALFAVIVILLFNKPVPHYWKFLGMISYSIYLIHFPIGVKLINLLKVRIDPFWFPFVFLFTLVAIIGISWVFYRFIEVPSENYSRKLKYQAQVNTN